MNTKTKIYILSIVALFGLFLFSKSAFAATYYVSTSGDDTNLGTQEEPFRHIQKAVDTVQAGDTVYVRGGTYNEEVSVTKSGAPNNYITLTSYGSETAIIDGTGLGGQWHALFHMWNVSYFKLNHLKFTNYVGECIQYTGTGSYIEVTDNEISYGNWPDPATYGGHAILFSSMWGTPLLGAIDHVKIDRNNIHHVMSGQRWNAEILTADYNIQYFQITNNTIDYWGWNQCITIGADNANENTVVPRNGIVSGNTVYYRSNPWVYGEQVGIVTNNAQDIVIQNNYIKGVPDQYGSGIVIEHEAWENLTTQRVIVRWNKILNTGTTCLNSGVDPSKPAEEMQHIRIVHNSCYKTNPYMYVVMGGHEIDAIYKNNIFQKAPGNPPMQFAERDTTDGGYSFDYNLWYPDGDGLWQYADSNYVNFAGWQAIGQDAHGLVADPLFTNPENGNFDLQSTSPAIDKGGFLTTTISAGSNTNIVYVQDTYYFFDGYGIASGDMIQIGQSTARVISVDYSAKTLTLDRSLSWGSNAGVSYPYYGSAPDMGAYESTVGGTTPSDTTPPSAPSGVVVQ